MYYQLQILFGYIKIILEANMQYYIYILTNKTHSTLYIGVTNNLQRRLYEHKNKLVDGFTKKYNVYKLVYYEVYQEIELAITREKVLKKWSRAKKNNLITHFNVQWNDLSDIVNA